MPAGHFSALGARHSISRWASALGENVIALVIGTLVLAAFMFLAAIDPATWRLQSNEASHLRAELRHCLSVAAAAARVDCYDGIAQQPPPHPARGANALPSAFGQEELRR